MPMSSPQMTRILGFFCSCFAISFSFHFWFLLIIFALRKVFPFLLILFTRPSVRRPPRVCIASPHCSILLDWIHRSISTNRAGRTVCLPSARNAIVLAILFHSFLVSVEPTNNTDSDWANSFLTKCCKAVYWTLVQYERYRDLQQTYRDIFSLFELEDSFQLFSMLMTVRLFFFASSYTAWLKPKPWHCEINARDHRERGNHPQPPRPESSCPSFGQQRSNKAEQERSECSRGGPAVPVHRGSKEPQRRIDDISRMVRARKDDANRGIDGDQCEVQFERDHVENRERCPVCKCEAA